MSCANKTLIVEANRIRGSNSEFIDQYKITGCSREFEDQLSQLWLKAYPPEIATGIEAAREEMRDMFADEYGEFWMDASPAIFDGDNLIAAICTVRKAPWPATPTCPFIIDMMVDPEYPRQGLAAHLIRLTARVISNGVDHLALRVIVDNLSAINLYYKLGFVGWDGKLLAPE